LGFIGGPFLVIQTLVPQKAISADFELISFQAQREVGTSKPPIVIIAIILTQIYFDLLVYLVDEILESRAKIKFLLLASGVKITSYWAVQLFKNALFVLPFISAICYILASAPELATITVEFVIIYFLQIIIFSAFLGTAFSEGTAKGLTLALRYLNLLLLLVLLTLAKPLKFTKENYELFNSFFIFIPCWSPMSAILTEQDMKEAITLDDNTLRGSNIGFIVLLIILFLMAEFRHLALPKIQSTVNDAFISFSNLSKSFGSKFLNDWLGVRYNPIPYKKAVNGLSLAVKKNELFALLGIFNLFN
jgi:hypothetical protein